MKRTLKRKSQLDIYTQLSIGMNLHHSHHIHEHLITCKHKKAVKYLTGLCAKNVNICKSVIVISEQWILLLTPPNSAMNIIFRVSQCSGSSGVISSLHFSFLTYDKFVATQSLMFVMLTTPL